MRLARTASLSPGITIGRDVLVGPSAGPLVRAGVALTEGMRASLVDSGVARVWVRDALGEGIEPLPLLGDRLRREALAAVAGLHLAARSALAKGGRLEPQVPAGLGRLAERIADDVLEARGRPHDLLDLAPASAYLPHHAVDSCALAMLVASQHMRTEGWRQGLGPVRHDVPRAELAQLGLGMLLCDLGMLALPRAVLEDASDPGEQGWEQIRVHPDTSASLLGASASFVLRGIVRGHHERWLGQGYPDGRRGEAIPYLARIAAVADSYDAMTAERHHREAMSPAASWASVTDGAGTAFDPGIAAAFAAVVPRHPLGTEVTLADGRVGVVADVDLADPLHPAVRVLDGDRVVEVVGAEVV